MKKLSIKLISCCVAFIIATLSLAQAQNVPEAFNTLQKGHVGQRIQEIYNQLNLTDTQKKQLEANKQQHRAKMESIRQAIKADKMVLQEELMKSQLDMPNILALHNKIKALQSKMEDIKLSSIIQVRSILTTEQFSAFVTLMRQHKQGRDK